MIKKALSILLASMMVFAVSLPSNAFAEENDYSNHWAGETIQTWLELGYANGYGEGIFKPNGFIKRAEFVTMVNNLFGFEEKGEIKFTDVDPNIWYYEQVQIGYKAGYISGISATKFAPEDLITREQASIIISKIMELDKNAAGIEIFADKNTISDWAKDYVGAAAEAKLLKGYENDNVLTFRPQNNITRAEAVTLLDRTLYYGPPLLIYAEAYEESGKKYLYLLFDEEINVSKLFSSDRDFSKLTGQVWGGAKVDLSYSDDFDDEIIIELASDTVLSDEITISANTLIDASGEINSEISSSIILVSEENLTVLNEEIVSYVNEDPEFYLLETYDTVTAGALKQALTPAKEGYKMEVLDSNGKAVLNTTVLNNSMVLRLYNDTQNVEKRYKISIVPSLSSNNPSAVSEVSNEFKYIIVKNGSTVGQVINAISSKTTLDSVQIVDYSTDEPISSNVKANDSMVLYIELGGWDYFYYSIIVE